MSERVTWTLDGAAAAVVVIVVVVAVAVDLRRRLLRTPQLEIRSSSCSCFPANGSPTPPFEAAQSSTSLNAAGLSVHACLVVHCPLRLFHRSSRSISSSGDAVVQQEVPLNYGSLYQAAGVMESSKPVPFLTYAPTATTRRTNSLGRAKSDCHTCSRFSRKCDRQRPRCSTCEQHEVLCGGYVLNLSWTENICVRSRASRSSSLVADDVIVQQDTAPQPPPPASQRSNPEVTGPQVRQYRFKAGRPKRRRKPSLPTQDARLTGPSHSRCSSTATLTDIKSLPRGSDEKRKPRRAPSCGEAGEWQTSCALKTEHCVSHPASGRTTGANAATTSHGRKGEWILQTDSQENQMSMSIWGNNAQATRTSAESVSETSPRSLQRSPRAGRWSTSISSELGFPSIVQYPDVRSKYDLLLEMCT